MAAWLVLLSSPPMTAEQLLSVATLVPLIVKSCMLTRQEGEGLVLPAMERADKSTVSLPSKPIKKGLNRVDAIARAQLNCVAVFGQGTGNTV